MADTPAPRTPTRRIRLIAIWIAVAAAAGIWSTHQPWYTLELASTVETPDGGTETFHAAGSITGARLVAPIDAPAFTPAAANTGTLPSRSGVPAPVIVALGAAIAAVAAAVLRSRVVSAVSVLIWTSAWSNLSQFRALAEAGGPGQHIRPAWGLNLFQASIGAGIALTVTLAVAVVVAHRAERLAWTEELTAAGHEPPLRLADYVAGARTLTAAKIRAATETTRAERSGPRP